MAANAQRKANRKNNTAKPHFRVLRRKYRTVSAVSEKFEFTFARLVERQNRLFSVLRFAA